MVETRGFLGLEPPVAFEGETRLRVVDCSTNEGGVSYIRERKSERERERGSGEGSTHLLLLDLNLQLGQQRLVDISPTRDLLRLFGLVKLLEDVSGEDDLARVGRDGPVVTLCGRFEEVLGELGKEVEGLRVRR